MLEHASPMFRKQKRQRCRGVQVFSEHDNSFKELNSQLLREAAAHDWARSARALAGDDASFHGDWQNEPHQQQSLPSATDSAALQLQTATPEPPQRRRPWRGLRSHLLCLL